MNGLESTSLDGRAMNTMWVAGKQYAIPAVAATSLHTALD